MDLKTTKIEKVRMLDRINSKKSWTGSLYLTATHLIFIDPDGKKEAWILHMHIASVTKLPISTSGSPLYVRCKDFLCVTFVIPRERDCHDIYTSLIELSQPTNIEELYCFSYTASNEQLSKKSGWNKFDLQAEYTRMGVPSDLWMATTINKNYEVCDTYPKSLFVPSAVSSAMLIESSRFRSRGRFPVLSYLHKNMASLCRCSQPLSGFTNARCPEDEQLLNCILRTSPNVKFMYVVDTRPKINAYANRAVGKGFENANVYENIKFQFFGIENIHVMRNSLQKLIDTCELKVPSMSAFLSGLESCGWLRHIKVILETASFIAKALEDGISVLVHCSDGWDRTAQTCSLAALLQDPYYRTITGFQALIEKEWLAFGHKFTERCGYIQGDPKEVAPVFTQFIDSVWQLSQQFPSAFQFNERFLLTVHDHVYSCQFGTFIGNCEKERANLRLSERTYSLWGFLNNHLSEFLNPLYKKDMEEIMRPNLAAQCFKFWRGMYNRFENGVHPRESLGDTLVATKDHISSLEDHIQFLEKRIDQLKKAMGKNGSSVKEDLSIMTDSGLAEELNCKLSLGNSKLSHNQVDVIDSGYGNGHFQDSNTPSDASPESTFDKFTFSQLLEEMETVALEWKSFRNVRECGCSTPFDHFSRKFHCWSCGNVFCIRCIDKRIPLHGHSRKRPVPVCRICYKEIMRTNSVDS